MNTMLKVLAAMAMSCLIALPALADNEDRKNQLQELGILKAKQCDTDCDGKLNLDELEAMGMQDKLPDGISVNELDTDGDGLISQQELDAYYTKEEIRKDNKRKGLQEKARKSKQPKIHF